MPESALPSSVEFNYVKSNYFRVIHVTGAFGGFSPDGGIFMAVFNERAPLPDVTIQSIESAGQLGAEIIEKRKSSHGIIRELEVGLAMNVQTARSLFNWLKERIELADQMTAISQPKNEVKQ